MVSKEEVLSIHKLEYEQIRNEICLRIELQNKVLNYALIVSGAFLAALGGWVLRDSRGNIIDLSKLFVDYSATLRAIVLVSGYTGILELLMCSWIFQTFFALNSHAYLSTLAKRMEKYLHDTSKGEILQYQTWRWTKGGKTGFGCIYWFMHRMQCVALYGLTFGSLIFLWILFLRKIISSFWLCVPIIMTLVFCFLLLSHKSAIYIARPTAKEFQEAESQEK